MTESFTSEGPALPGDRPELTWPGKHPLRCVSWHPSRLRESYGCAHDGWMNRLYCGDNVQVMAHLLRGFRGKVDLAYIDPPFCSNADYASLVHPRGRPAYPFLPAFSFCSGVKSCKFIVAPLERCSLVVYCMRDQRPWADDPQRAAAPVFISRTTRACT